MSDVYDITVYPSILNGSGVNLSGCVSYRFLRSIQVPLADRLQFGYDTYNYTISEKTKNSKLFLSVLKGGDGWGEPGGGVFSYYNVFYISEASIGGVDGNVVSITTYGVNYGNSPLVPNAGIVNVYEILPEGSQEANNNYSIKIYNGVDWTAFDSHLSIGAMHRKYSVTVGSAGWELPMDVPDRDNCLVFGDWDSASSSIIYRNVEHKLYAFPGPVNIDIYVFSNTPNLTVGEYGLLMYNSLGELTFSSENPPLCYPYEGFVIDSTPRQLPFLNNLVQLSTFGVRYTTTLSRIHLWDVNVLRAGNMISLIQGNLRVDVVQKVGVTELPIPPGRPLILNRDIYGK